MSLSRLESDIIFSKRVQIDENEYIYHAKISGAKFRQILKCFALDLTATQTAEMISINRNAINGWQDFA